MITLKLNNYTDKEDIIPTKVICLTLNFLSPALLKDKYKKAEPINKIILPKILTK